MELIVVMVISAILMGWSAPRLRGAIDRSAVRGAVNDAATAYGYARRMAVTRRTNVAVRLDTGRVRLLVHAGAETLLVRSLGERYGVRFRGSRDSMAFDARGLGYGAANLSVVLERGAVAETVFISRLGRIRH
jgi:hypothetical protein